MLFGALRLRCLVGFPSARSNDGWPSGGRCVSIEDLRLYRPIRSLWKELGANKIRITSNWKPGDWIALPRAETWFQYWLIVLCRLRHWRCWHVETQAAWHTSCGDLRIRIWKKIGACSQSVPKASVPCIAAKLILSIGVAPLKDASQWIRINALRKMVA
jgi:hypothetical protein